MSENLFDILNALFNRLDFKVKIGCGTEGKMTDLLSVNFNDPDFTWKERDI
jgi:hypothetical protein